MYSAKILVVLCSAHFLLAQFLPLPSPAENSSEENDGQSTASRSTSCPCGWTNKNGRIIGGKKALPNEFPFIVAIKSSKSRRYPFCGGSILTERHVLTAAHCTTGKKYEGLFITVGNYDFTDEDNESEQVIYVDYTVEHAFYDEVNENTALANDIAIMILKESIVFNQLIGPICMPTEDLNLIGRYIKAMGWGIHNVETGKRSKQLMKVNLKVADISNCAIYKEEIRSYINGTTQICTFRKDRDTCQGDSGGPLVIKDSETDMLIQVALVSYGLECGKEYPGVNTNVFFYLPWIKTTLSEHSNGVNICQKI